MQTTFPELCGRCNSWVIACNDNALFETFDRLTAETIARRNYPGVVVYTSLQWLQHFNTRTKAGA